MDEAGDILYSPSPSSTTLPWACHRLKKERGQIQTCEHLGRLQAVYVSPKLELAMPKAHVCGECVSLANHCQILMMQCPLLFAIPTPGARTDGQLGFPERRQLLPGSR